MWRNMDDRLERRRELVIPGGALEEENIGGWSLEGEGNAFPEMDSVGKSGHRKVLHSPSKVIGPFRSMFYQQPITGRRELAREEQETLTAHTGNF